VREQPVERVLICDESDERRIGGFKQSSANTFKEQGQAAMDFYTRTKTIYVNHG